MAPHGNQLVQIELRYVVSQTSLGPSFYSILIQVCTCYVFAPSEALSFLAFSLWIEFLIALFRLFFNRQVKMDMSSDQFTPMPAFPIFLGNKKRESDSNTRRSAYETELVPTPVYPALTPPEGG